MAWISSINLSTRFWFFNFMSSEPLQIKSVFIKKYLGSVHFIPLWSSTKQQNTSNTRVIMNTVVKLSF